MSYCINLIGTLNLEQAQIFPIQNGVRFLHLELMIRRPVIIQNENINNWTGDSQKFATKSIVRYPSNNI